MRDLSVLIPARNERWLGHTVRDVCANKRGNTEVIVILDGAWPEQGYELEQHPDVQVVYMPESIGQRAATNLAANISEARYICKLDAHCSVAEGFDVELIRTGDELGPSVTQIPAQKNLHIYDRVCPCGKREYQGSPKAKCKACGKTDWTLDIKWKPRKGTTTTSWRFDSEMHFQYWGKGKTGGDVRDVMTSLGACVFLDRQRFLSQGGLDTEHGSWGQFGVELALKAWLSGGRHVCNTRTWFAHFFRVGGIGFPYQIKAGEQEYARQYSRNLWKGNQWPGQVRPLRWVLDKFWPVPGWTEEQRDALPAAVSRMDAGDCRVDDRDRGVLCHPEVVADVSAGEHRRSGYESGARAGIVYYSDCRGDADIFQACRSQLIQSAGSLPIVSVTLKPVSLGQNIVLPLERGYLTMFKQILAGLETLDTEYAFLAEHDVIYTPEHFQFRPPNDSTYFYNLHWWKVDHETGHAVTYTAKQTSQLCANRELLIKHYRERVRRVEADGFTRAMGFEPGSHNRKERIDDVPSDVWRSTQPNYDIRHGHNLTPSRWRQDQFKSQRNCQDWRETTINHEVLRVQQAVA